MKFGNSKFGSTQFGHNGEAGIGEPAGLEVQSTGSVRNLKTQGHGESTLVGDSSGTPTNSSYRGDSEPNHLDLLIRHGSGGISISVRGEYHLAVGVEGHTSNRVLTISGRFPELVQSIEPVRYDIPERQRIEGYLKTPFESQYPVIQSGGVREPGEFADLVDLYGEFAQGIATIRNEVLANRYVDLANGQSLDFIGTLLLLPRRRGEEDPHYRLRLKSYARALTGEATIPQIRKTIALLLQCQVSDINLTESDVPAQFSLRIDRTILENALVSLEELVDLVAFFKAGGVRVRLTLTGSFTNRSVEDVRNDVDLGEKGYEEAYYSGTIEIE